MISEVTTWNTTYNYNMPNMNFGQAMLYGAFGSLTGMGGYGCGMGGSIFSNMGMYGMGGFGGYGMGMNSFGYGMGMSGFGMGGYGCGMSNQGIGAMIGMIVAGAGLAFANQAITEHKASKAEKVDPQTTVDNLEEKIAELKEKKDKDTIAKGLDAKYDAAIKSAEKEYAKYTSTPATDTYTTKINALNDANKKLDATKPDEKEKIDANNAEIAKLNAERIGAEAEAKQAVADAKQEKEDAIKEKQDEIQKEIDKLNKQLTTAKAAAEAAALEKADGNSLQRMNEDKYKETFLNSDGTVKTDIDSSNITKKAIRTAAMRLKSATTDSEKYELGLEYQILYTKWSDSSEKKGYLKEAKLIADKYVKEFKPKTQVSE